MSQYAQLNNIAPDTGSNQVKIGFGKIKGLFISTAGTLPRITIYDSATASTSDPEIIHQFAPTNATVRLFSGDIGGITFSKGLYVVITGDVSMTVIYE
jgi:tetrahydromethanopterin S-methyltransferase subunit E